MIIQITWYSNHYLQKCSVSQNKCARNIRMSSHWERGRLARGLSQCLYNKNLKYFKFPLFFRLYLLLLQLHSLAEAPQGVSGWVQLIWKGRLPDACLWPSKLRKSRKTVKGQDNGECPRMVYYIQPWFVIPVYDIPQGCLIYLCVGFCVVRLDSWAMRRPRRWDGQ